MSKCSASKDAGPSTSSALRPGTTPLRRMGAIARMATHAANREGCLLAVKGLCWRPPVPEERPSRRQAPDALDRGHSRWSIPERLRRAAPVILDLAGCLSGVPHARLLLPRALLSLALSRCGAQPASSRAVGLTLGGGAGLVRRAPPSSGHAPSAHGLRPASRRPRGRELTGSISGRKM